MGERDELKGRVALVTGASRNIGRAIALDLAAGGAAVIINTRQSSAAAEAVAREIEACGVFRQVRIALLEEPPFLHDAAEGLALMLKLNGHEVRAAYEGPSALALAEAFRPQVVLLDLGLPGMDGYEVARRLRGQADLKATYLVAVTGWGQPEDRQRSKEMGFDRHLVKPVDSSLLVQLLAELEASVT